MKVYPFSYQRVLLAVAFLGTSLGFLLFSVLSNDGAGVVGGTVMVVASVPVALDLLYSHIRINSDELVLVRAFRRRVIRFSDVKAVEFEKTFKGMIQVEFVLDSGESVRMDSTFTGRRRGTRRLSRRLIAAASLWEPLLMPLAVTSTRGVAVELGGDPRE